MSVIRSIGTPPGLVSSSTRSKPASLPLPSWVGWAWTGGPRVTARSAAPAAAVIPDSLHRLKIVPPE
jgi:hypothetical protein